MIKEFELLERKKVDSNRVFDYCKDTLKLPDGRIRVYETLVHKGAAAIVPVLPDGRILMVRQYRHAIRRVSLEIPAGGRNGREEPFEVAAKRELEEETGYRCGEMTHLISIVTAIAYCDEVIEVYVAGDLVPTRQNLDPDEFIDVCPYTLEELVRMIYEGQIQDSKTIASVMAYKDKYGN